VVSFALVSLAPMLALFRIVSRRVFDAEVKPTLTLTLSRFAGEGDRWFLLLWFRSRQCSLCFGS
jgi:hypothetical protein